MMTGAQIETGDYTAVWVHRMIVLEECQEVAAVSYIKISLAFRVSEMDFFNTGTSILNGIGL